MNIKYFILKLSLIFLISGCSSWFNKYPTYEPTPCYAYANSNDQSKADVPEVKKPNNQAILENSKKTEFGDNRELSSCDKVFSLNK